VLWVALAEDLGASLHMAHHARAIARVSLSVHGRIPLRGRPRGTDARQENGQTHSQSRPHPCETSTRSPRQPLGVGPTVLMWRRTAGTRRRRRVAMAGTRASAPSVSPLRALRVIEDVCAHTPRRANGGGQGIRTMAYPHLSVKLLHPPLRARLSPAYRPLLACSYPDIVSSKAPYAVFTSPTGPTHAG
jgi:hypothetical protein